MDIQRGLQKAREEVPPRRESVAFVIAVFGSALGLGAALWWVSGRMFPDLESRGLFSALGASLPDSVALLMRTTGLSARIGSAGSGKDLVSRVWRVFYTRRRPAGSRYWLPVLALTLLTAVWVPAEWHFLRDVFSYDGGRALPSHSP